MHGQGQERAGGGFLSDSFSQQEERQERQLSDFNESAITG